MDPSLLEHVPYLLPVDTGVGFNLEQKSDQRALLQQIWLCTHLLSSNVALDKQSLAI
jgi:hypothetical protein